MRASTSLNQANGSTLTSSQEAMKLRSTAAVWPPRSLPKNVQLDLLCTRVHKRSYAQSLIMCSPLLVLLRAYPNLNCDSWLAAIPSCA